MSKSSAKVVPIRPRGKKPARGHPDLAAAEAAYLDAFERCRVAEAEHFEAVADHAGALKAQERAAKVLALAQQMQVALGPFGQILPASAQVNEIVEAARLSADEAGEVLDDTGERSQSRQAAGVQAAALYGRTRATYLRAAAQAFGGDVPLAVESEVAWRDREVKKLMEGCEVHPWPGWAGKDPGL